MQGRARKEAEAEAPILEEAREMLRKWEAGDPEVKGTLGDDERMGI